MALTKRYELEDSQWEKIASFFPEYRTGRPPKVYNCSAFNAIIWLMCSVAPWRNLPEYYGSWQTIYSRFRLQLSSGLFERIFRELIDDAGMENLSLDSTIVRAHQKATGAKKRTLFD